MSYLLNKTPRSLQISFLLIVVKSRFYYRKEFSFAIKTCKKNIENNKSIPVSPLLKPGGILKKNRSYLNISSMVIKILVMSHNCDNSNLKLTTYFFEYTVLEIQFRSVNLTLVARIWKVLSKASRFLWKSITLSELEFYL